MRIQTILKIYGLLLMLISLTFLPPFMIEEWFQESTIRPFVQTFFLTFIAGFLFWVFFRQHQHPLRTHDGFLIVVLFWGTLSLISAFPFYWSPSLDLNFTRAFFEAVSGVTTTGSSIMTNLDGLPHAVLYYRQQLQLLGGISIIVLAVALLPALGIGGMQLFKNEMSGPVKDDKLTPRVTHTAKAIWIVYMGLTLLCALCYHLAGMTVFDAICHSFSTVATGGFSTHDNSFAYFQQPAIRIIAIIFMFVGAINFSLHYLAINKRQLSVYFQNTEWQGYVKFVAASCIIVYLAILIYGSRYHPHLSLLDVCFETISILTTTGYMSKNISLWPGFVPLFILFCGVIGGCSGSTSGGIKTMRAMLLQKQGKREIKRLIHPRAIYMIHFGKTPLSSRVIEAIWGYFVTYCVIFTILLLLLLAANEDFFTVYTALIATFSNGGRALGEVTYQFSSLSSYSLWVLSAAMILGRLEIFTILVLLSPAFWRK